MMPGATRVHPEYASRRTVRSAVMPALDKQSVEHWLRTHAPDAAARAATSDIQADDMASVLSEMVRLGQALDDAFAHDPVGLSARLQQPGPRSSMRAVIGHASPAQRIRLLQWFSSTRLPNRDRIMAGLLADDPSAAPGADAGKIARESIRRLNRSALLARLFSPERISRLLSMCPDGKDMPCNA